MPTTVVQSPPTKEPVTLAQLNAHLRLDYAADTLAQYIAGELADEAVKGQLDNLATDAIAARELVEGYTGRILAGGGTLELTYTLGEPYVLPAGAEATGVTGFFSDLDALNERSTWLEEYRKGISINRELPWGAAMEQTYTVTVELPEDLRVPALVKTAIRELVSEWNRNRDSTADARGLGELPVAWRVKLASLVLNPLGNG